MTAKIDTHDFRTVLNRLAGELERPRALYAKASRHMRDYVRQTISVQGRPTPWAPLSDLYKRRTGKFKAMLSLRDRIEANWDDTGGWIYFRGDASDKFTLSQLEKGWRQGPFKMPFIRNKRGKLVRKRMVIPMARGAKTMFLKERRGFSVPGRKIFPGKQEAQRELSAIARQHFEDFVRAR